MCLGVLPSKDISSVYGLHELFALGEATRKGDLKSFDKVAFKYSACVYRCDCMYQPNICVKLLLILLNVYVCA